MDGSTIAQMSLHVDPSSGILGPDDGRETLAAAYPVHLASVRFRVVDRLDDSDVDALTRIFTTIGSGLRDEHDTGNAVTP